MAESARVSNTTKIERICLFCCSYVLFDINLWVLFGRVERPSEGHVPDFFSKS